MTNKPWNGDAFRKWMQTESANARRYADEHRGRLKRKQSNGSASFRDEYDGRSAACDILSTSAATEDRDELKAYLDKMEKAGVDPGVGVNKDDFRRGVGFLINEVRSFLK